MRNIPFGFPETAVDRILREERQRATFENYLFGDRTLTKAIRDANEYKKLLGGFDFSRVHSNTMDTLERDRKEREAFKRLASQAWALSVTKTAHSIAKQHSDLINGQRLLSDSLLDTVKALDANRSGLGAAAIAAASAGDTYRRAIAGIMPSISRFGAIAERMAMLDLMTLRASEDLFQSATATAAEMVIETRRIAEAIAEAPSDAESARLYGSLIDALLTSLTNLGPNTVAELQKMGLVGYLLIVLALVSFYTDLTPEQSTQSPQDKAAFAQLNAKVDQLKQKTADYHKAVAQNDQRYLMNMPRAELTRNATFRQNPLRDGSVVMHAPREMVVAIAKVQGRWRFVIYIDPLSGQPAQAWVYSAALSPLAPPIGIDEPPS